MSHIRENGDFALYHFACSRFGICADAVDSRMGRLLDTDGELWGINFERFWRRDHKRLVLCDFERRVLSNVKLRISDAVT